MEILHWGSIVLEMVIAFMGVRLISQKKVYGWGIFVTFGIYVFYDIAKYTALPISLNLLYFLFFIASLSAFLAVWNLLNNKK